MNKAQNPPPDYECVEVPDVIRAFSEHYHGQVSKVKEQFQKERETLKHEYEKAQTSLGDKETTAILALQTSYMEWIANCPAALSVTVSPLPESSTAPESWIPWFAGSNNTVEQKKVATGAPSGVKRIQKKSVS